jgi:hypothetical protein
MKSEIDLASESAKAISREYNVSTRRSHLLLFVLDRFPRLCIAARRRSRIHPTTARSSARSRVTLTSIPATSEINERRRSQCRRARAGRQTFTRGRTTERASKGDRISQQFGGLYLEEQRFGQVQIQLRIDCILISACKRGMTL